MSPEEEIAVTGVVPQDDESASDTVPALAEDDLASFKL